MSFAKKYYSGDEIEKLSYENTKLQKSMTEIKNIKKIESNVVKIEQKLKKIDENFVKIVKEIFKNAIDSIDECIEQVCRNTKVLKKEKKEKAF